MDIFHSALKKASQEGSLDPRLASWDQPKGAVKKAAPRFKKLQLPQQLLAFPDAVIHDLQKVIENIRLIAEARSMQVIGISSAVPGQGTSSMTAILSLLLAAREKVAFEQTQAKSGEDKSTANSRLLGALLLDTQFRHPGLYHKLGLKKSEGLIEILENELPFNNGVRNIPDSSLKLINTGLDKNFQLTQTHLQKFRAILQYLKTRVEFILLDIPALLPYSEGIALSKLCDGVVLVVRSGEIRWEVLQEARKLLDRAAVPVIGGVLNRREFFIPSWAYRSI